MRGVIDDEKNAPEWEKIKQWVGQRQPTRKDPITQIAEREHARVQKFDDGGMVGDDFTVNTGDSSTVKTPSLGVHEPIDLGSIPPPAAPLSMPPATPAPRMPAAPPAAPEAPAAPAAAPSAEAPSPTDRDFTHMAEREMGGVSPEQLAAMLSRAYKPSGGELAGLGVAGIGDAIASIGGRTPGAAKDVQEMMNKRRDAQMQLPEQMSKLGQQRYELSRKLQADNPNSPLSKSAQRTYDGDLRSLGFTPEEIANMNFTNIGEATKTGADIGKIKAEMKMKAVELGLKGKELGLKGQEIAETGRHDLAEEGAKGEELTAKAQEETAKHPLLHPFNAMRASNALAKAGGAVPDHGAALNWSRSNPNDPRAKVILQRATNALSQ
jgi:hypothetical protein